MISQLLALSNRPSVNTGTLLNQSEYLSTIQYHNHHSRYRNVFDLPTPSHDFGET